MSMPSESDNELIEYLRIGAETARWRSGGIAIEETDEWKAAERITALLEAAAVERAAWRQTMKDLGPFLKQAKEEGILDQIIDGNVWPEPPCVISDADIQEAVDVARKIRPQIEAGDA
jgi:hypothetical protein